MKQTLLLTATDLRCKSAFTRTYRFSASSLTQVQGKLKENEYTRELVMEYLPSAWAGGPAMIRLQVTREKLVLDSGASHLEYIIKALSAVTHRIMFRLNNRTGAITLENHDDIRNAWGTVRYRLRKDYSGTEIATFTEQYGHLIYDKQALTEALCAYHLYGLFVNRVNVLYPYTGQLEIIKQFSHIPVIGKFAIAETRTLQDKPAAASDALRIQITGVLATQPSYSGYGNIPGIPAGIPLQLKNYSGTYLLDAGSYIMRSATLQYQAGIKDAYLRKCSFLIDTIE